MSVTSRDSQTYMLVYKHTYIHTYIHTNAFSVDDSLVFEILQGLFHV
jgi:hypothetical protein